MNLGPGGSETDVVAISVIRWSVPGREEPIGFLYRRYDGSEWIGTRKSTNMTDAGLRQFRAFLDAVRAKRDADALPVRRDDNGFVQYRVSGVRAKLNAFDLRLVPCVEWPQDRTPP